MGIMSKPSSQNVSRRGRRLTPLGKRLDEIRERIEASGEPLLSSWEEIDRELAERRGENPDEPDDPGKRQNAEE